MVKRLLKKCKECQRYTLNTKVCPYCNGKVQISHPAKFSLDDKYIKYKILMRKKEK